MDIHIHNECTYGTALRHRIEINPLECDRRIERNTGLVDVFHMDSHRMDNGTQSGQDCVGGHMKAPSADGFNASVEVGLGDVVGHCVVGFNSDDVHESGCKLENISICKRHEKIWDKTYFPTSDI